MFPFDGRPDLVVRLQRPAVPHAHVHEPLRELLHRVAVGQVGALERLEREQGGGGAVAGGHEARVDDVPRLLAAERPAAAQQLGEHGAVAHAGGGHLDAGVGHGAVEAVVGHHRHGHAIARQPALAAQVQGGERHQLVAVHHRAVAIHRQDAIAVAVEGEAHVMAAGNALGQALHVGGPAFVVDVAAVGIRRDHLEVGAQAPEDLGCHAVGGAVGAVEQDAAAGQVQVAEAELELAHVVAGGAVKVAHPADADGGVARRAERLDLLPPGRRPAWCPRGRRT